MQYFKITTQDGSEYFHEIKPFRAISDKKIVEDAVDQSVLTPYEAEGAVVEEINIDDYEVGVM